VYASFAIRAALDWATRGAGADSRTYEASSRAFIGIVEVVG